MKCLAHFRHFALSLALCVFGFHPAWADDTEIFFSSIPDAELQPNILLVLDASASMLFYDDCPGAPRSEHPCAPAESEEPNENRVLTRQQRMNKALSEVLNQISNVNVGVMRFSNLDSGGRIIYPVRNLEEKLCDGIPCQNAAGFTGNVSTVRQAVSDSITSMRMQWVTPTVDALSEAERYFSGQAVHYGKKRWWAPCDSRTTAAARNRCNQTVTILGGPRERGEHSNVSHPDSYTGGVVTNRPEICDTNPTDESCASEEINGNPVYTSPIANECQSNHILLVTDGEANATSNAVKNRFGSCAHSGITHNNGVCAAEMAAYMANNDLVSGIEGSTVTTHTVGFNLDSDWLKDIAEKGGGDYFTASSSSDLVTALVEIINDVQRVDSTFVAPGVTVDQFSRLSHRKDTYLALFEPSNTPQWPGNMKRYDLTGGALYDSSDPAKVAVNAYTGQFVRESKSFWSAGQDGHHISAGGAAENLPHYNDRKAVTYTGEKASLFHEDNALLASNSLNLDFFETDEVKNVAPEGYALQSSTDHGGTAGRAIDSNTNGNWNNNSITHTDKDAASHWWQLTLPKVYSIENIEIYGRTNCCKHRLSDVHVFVSETPFGTETLEELVADNDIWHHYYDGQMPTHYTIPVDVNGRYIRIQKESPEALSLAEVEVYAQDLPAEELARKKAIIDWARGKDLRDDDKDTAADDNRYYMGDPLHSKPSIVTYGYTADESPESVVFMGTNEGYLHAINASTGIEEFAFMPQELIPNLETLYENSKFDDKVYGMDGDISTWIHDSNNDRKIEKNDGDHAYLYVGMRRGGSEYYALNVTDRDNPQYLFSIPETDPTGFAELGQSWSKPVLASILVGSDKKKVLIFAGGYDESQDDKATYAPDTTGRAIFIVDAEDGSLIWSGQPTAKAGYPIKAFPAMQYSIPSDVKVVDPDGDGLASQIYVGDMGGQIWRFDIKNDGSTDTDLVEGGVIASFGEADDAAKARRFYHEPDLVLSKYQGKLTLNIGIGSGYQAHPLDSTIEDSFYQFRYPLKDTGNYGIKDTNDNSYKPITQADLYDATDNLVVEGDETAVERANLASKLGWRITMERAGEKILGASATLNNVVRFISYVPTSNSSEICGPDIGKSYYWRVGLADGTPDGHEDSTGDLKKDDRWEDVPGGGIAPPVTTVFVSDETSGEVVPNDVSGINVLNEDENANTTRRWYWAEIPE